MMRRLERWAPWVAGIVLLAGVAAYSATRLAGGSSPAAAPAPAATVVEPTVPLDPKARAVAKAFVATAVARRDLDRAWQLAAPALRGDLTLAEWRTGNIPVQPYPVARATASYAVKASHPDSALLQLTFRPHKASGAQPGQFDLGLARIGGRWLVTTYVPASTVGPSPSS